MASNHTTNYQLCQWEATDKVLRTDFNQDNAKIDAALAALQQGKGNCHILAGNYVGTGHYNTSGASTLTFDHIPLAVFIYNPSIFFAVRGNTSGQVLNNGGGWTISVQWSEHGLTWYSRNSAAEQMNTSGQTYYYLALFAVDE